MKMMKKIRISALFLCAATLLLALTPLFAGAAEDPETHYTSHCCVANADTGEILYQKGADDRVATAGTAKMMTALLALEHYGDGFAEKTLTVSEKAVSDEDIGLCIGLDAGKSVLVSDLLAALIIANYNDAALALAVDIAGDVDKFVDMMNKRAAELGMENTHYLNPTGLDETGMYTTAHDVTLLGELLAGMPSFINFSDAPSYTVSSIKENKIIYNRNLFVSTYYNLNYLRESVAGISSSKTDSVGQCICAADKTDKGFTFIVTVMGAAEPEKEPFNGCVAAYEDAIDLLRWASASFELFTVVDTADMICEVPVKLSSSVDHVILLPKTRLNVVFPIDVDIDDEIEYSWTLTKKELSAPISEGEVVGTLHVVSKSKGALGDIDLVAKSHIERSAWLFFLEGARRFISNPFIMILIFLALAALVGVVILLSMYIHRKNRRVRYRTPKDR